MMTMVDSFEALHAIEAQADRATVQELRRMIIQARQLLPGLDGEGRAFAAALMLKLDRLARDQMVHRAGPDVGPLPV
jgi:hypothetical protein